MRTRAGLFFLFLAVVATISAVLPGYWDAGESNEETRVIPPNGTAVNGTDSSGYRPLNMHLHGQGAYNWVSRAGESAIELEAGHIRGNDSYAGDTFSVRFWFRPDRGNRGWRRSRLISFGGDAGFTLYGGSPSFPLVVADASGRIQMMSDRTSWSEARWYPVMIRKDDAYMELVVNGTVVDRERWAGNGSLTGPVVGRGFTGGIDDVQLYSTILPTGFTQDMTARPRIEGRKAMWTFSTRSKIVPDEDGPTADSPLIIEGEYNWTSRAGTPAVNLSGTISGNGVYSGDTFSVRFWFRPDRGNRGWRRSRLISFGGDAGFTLYGGDVNTPLVLAIAEGNKMLVSPQRRWNPRRWYAISIIAGNQRVKMTVNGLVVDRARWRGNGSMFGPVVGRGFTGGIDDIQIYSKVIQAREPDLLPVMTTDISSRSIERQHSPPAALDTKLFGIPASASAIERKYGPFTVDGEIYYLGQSNASARWILLSSNGTVLSDADIRQKVAGIKALYTVTRVDPLFYAPALIPFQPRMYSDYTSRLVSRDSFFVNRTHQQYINTSLIGSNTFLAQHVLGNLSRTARRTKVFFQHSSYENGKQLLNRYEKTVDAYSEDFSDLITIFRRAHSDRDGNIQPVSVQFQLGPNSTNTSILLQDFRLVAKNLEALRGDIAQRRTILRRGRAINISARLWTPPSRDDLERLSPVFPRQDWHKLVQYRWGGTGFFGRANKTKWMAPGVKIPAGKFQEIAFTRGYHVPMECLPRSHLITWMPYKEDGRFFAVDAVPRRINHLPVSPAEMSNVSTSFREGNLYIDYPGGSDRISIAPERGPSTGRGDLIRVGSEVGIGTTKWDGQPAPHRCLYLQQSYMNFFAMHTMYEDINRSKPFRTLLTVWDRWGLPNTTRHNNLYRQIQEGRELEKTFLRYPSLQSFRKLGAAYGQVYYAFGKYVRNSSRTVPAPMRDALTDARGYYISMRTRLSGFAEAVDYFYHSSEHWARWWSHNYYDYWNITASTEEKINPVNVLFNAMYPIMYIPESPAIWRLDQRPRKYASYQRLPKMAYFRPGSDRG